MAPDLGQAIPFVASTPRYETCEELTAAACEAFQQMVEGGGEIGSLVEARAKIVGLFPDGALDLMMRAANVESVEALSALIGGFSGLESMSPEQFAVPEGYDLAFVGSAGEDYTEEELENLNDSLKESGFDARVTAAKKVDVKVRVAVENEGSSQGAQQPDAQTIAVVDAIEVDGGWYVSPKEKLAEVVEGARAVSETEFASFSTSRNDGAPTISFDYPTQWEDNSLVAGDDPSSPLGPNSEIAGANAPNGNCGVALYYFSGEMSREDAKAVVTKIRDAAFDPGAVSAGGPTDSGPYVVAEVAWNDPVEEHVLSKIALVPSSFVGEHMLSLLQSSYTMPFQCAGQTVIFTGSGDLAAFGDRQMVSIILGSATVS